MIIDVVRFSLIRSNLAAPVDGGSKEERKGQKTQGRKEAPLYSFGSAALRPLPFAFIPSLLWMQR
jgi:hypothetical protein